MAARTKLAVFVLIVTILSAGQMFYLLEYSKASVSVFAMLSELSERAPVQRSNENKKNEVDDRIWHVMSDEQQDTAMQEILPYIQAHADELRKTPRHVWHYYGRCDNVWVGGERYGGKSLCNFTADDDCTFISFGIEDSYKFDEELSDGWNCHGFAADPSVTHSSQLHKGDPGVTFHKIGATTLTGPPENETWWVSSVPGVMNLLLLDHLTVLKMDCEGCEYALSRDILLEDPNMLYKIDQVTMEFHVSKFWLNTKEALYYFGMLLKLLKEAGFRLQASQIGGCAGEHEVGCMQELQDMNYPGPCETNPPKQLISCHEYLWAKHLLPYAS